MEPTSNPINNNTPVQVWVKPDVTVISIADKTLGDTAGANDGLGSS